MNNKQLRLNIDGKEVLALPGQTILEVAEENEIFIPTLCFDERTRIYGSCGLCLCEVEGSPKLAKACATPVTPNMVIKTNSERIRQSRKTNLELLLSNHKGDCRPPCVIACPAHTDCQGYVGLIANGEYEEALKLVKDKIPLPASLGRVCPHPCEDECRRGMIDEAISIQMLKRFVADNDLSGEDGDKFIPECPEDSGRTVGIIGSGPMGLSAAYFLRQYGHRVTILEAMPKAGGMLRYGIPEYRLPKVALDAEIETIEAMGVKIKTGIRIGEDASFERVRENYDAVLVAMGAWVSTGVRCKGEDTPGVVGGIDFLRRVVRNDPVSMGKRVAIVGGGNVAMDACRTAVRLGAETVYNVYRRTKNEMPADIEEVNGAEEEGVIFKNLTNPLEIIPGRNGRVSRMKLQVMELGDMDASGRRRPVPVEGKTETIEVDTVIMAIGQAVDASVIKRAQKTKKGAIAYDTKTFMTSLEGVFAGGDCGNDKVSIAVEAIADAKKVAQSIDAYLTSGIKKYEPPYLVRRTDINEKTFEDRERMCRPDYDTLSVKERKDNFAEVIPRGYTEEAAVQEAERCLECGCQDYFECKLIDFANQYGVEPDRFAGDINEIDYEDDHPFIIRDPNKCIMCGLCVRTCDEVMGIGALGLVDRGFDVAVMPNMKKPLAESGCVCCGQCVSVCPCGALQERKTTRKEVPLKTEKVETTCAYCSIGCTFDLEYRGDMIIKADPRKNGYVNDGVSCGRGKFGFDCSLLEGKIEEPMIREGDAFRTAEYYEALMRAAKKAEAIVAKYGKDAVAVSVSDRLTNEEIYVIKKMADDLGARSLCFNNRENGLEHVLGVNASPNTIDEVCSTDVVLVLGFNTADHPVMQLKIREAAGRGARVLLVNPRGYEQNFDFAEKIWYTRNDISVLKEIAKALISSGAETKGLRGVTAFKKSLSDVKVSSRAAEIAEIYGSARKAMIVYEQNLVTTEAAEMIGNIALLSGHIGGARDGILQIRPKNNSQGLAYLGVNAGAEAMKGVKALITFGEDPDEKYTDGLELLVVIDTHMTDTAQKANVVIPGTGSTSIKGTFTNTERRMMPVNPAIDEGILLSNWEVAAELANIFEYQYDFEDTFDITREMDETVPAYKFNIDGKIYGTFLEPVKPKLAAVGNARFVAPMETTDNLMKVIQSRIPAMANMTE